MTVARATRDLCLDCIVAISKSPPVVDLIKMQQGKFCVAPFLSEEPMTFHRQILLQKKFGTLCGRIRLFTPWAIESVYKLLELLVPQPTFESSLTSGAKSTFLETLPLADELPNNAKIFSFFK